MYINTNRYAESYKLLENDINDLRNENQNLKENLKINKEIIEKFYLDNNKNKDNFYYEKIKQENFNLSNQNETMLEENKELRNQVNFTFNKDKLFFLNQVYVYN